MKYEIPIQRLTLLREGTIETDCIDAETASNVFFQLIGDRDGEAMAVIYLNTKNKICGCSIVHIGTLDSTMAHARDIFKGAILNNAKSVIIGHNHPSGDCTPSTADAETTFQLIHAGTIIGINILDHIIVNSDGQFKSLKKLGYI